MLLFGSASSMQIARVRILSVHILPVILYRSPLQPVVFDAIKHELTLTVVVEPPWKPLAFRHAWQDAPQCMLFGSSSRGALLPGGAVPLPPFNVSVPIGLL